MWTAVTLLVCFVVLAAALGVGHKLSARRCTPTAPPPSDPPTALERGDLVDITGTPFIGLVLAADAAGAWCRTVKAVQVVSLESCALRIAHCDGDPRWRPRAQLLVVDRGFTPPFPN